MVQAALNNVKEALIKSFPRHSARSEAGLQNPQLFNKDMDAAPVRSMTVKKHTVQRHQ